MPPLLGVESANLWPGRLLESANVDFMKHVIRWNEPKAGPLLTPNVPPKQQQQQDSKLFALKFRNKIFEFVGLGNENPFVLLFYTCGLCELVRRKKPETEFEEVDEELLRKLARNDAGKERGI